MILEKVKEILAVELKVKKENIKLESSFKNDLCADSLKVMESIMALEDEFNIEVSSEDVGSIKTVNDVVEYINSKQ